MATISQKEWNRYIARLRHINDTAAEEFKNLIIDKGGYGHIERQKLIDYAYGISTKYGEASATLSAEMYDALAELSGVRVPSAIPAETASYQEVAKTVNGIIKKSSNENMLADGIGRLVKMAGTDTILSNAHRDRPKGRGSKRKHSGAQVAWIPHGDTCPFCLMLASRGWVYQTQWGANNHSEHIHANCDCTYAVRFNNNLSFDGYDPDEYKAIYNNAEGKTRDEKFNSMRREYREENKDKINAQKRANYARNNLTNGNDGGIIKVQEKRPEPLRIPQIPASSISKKVENGQYSLRLTQQSYDKHVPGTKTYDTYYNARQEKGLNPQSVLTISKEEAQDIIIKQSGTGIIKPRRDGTATDIEQITCDRIIGYYYQKGDKIPTNKAAIHHGRKGSHIIPIKGNHYD